MKIEIKAVLDTFEDRHDIDILKNCFALHCGVLEFKEYLRKLNKYDENLDDKQQEILTKIIDKFFEECGEYINE